MSATLQQKCMRDVALIYAAYNMRKYRNVLHAYFEHLENVALRNGPHYISSKPNSHPFQKTIPKGTSSKMIDQHLQDRLTFLRPLLGFLSALDIFLR